MNGWRIVAALAATALAVPAAPATAGAVPARAVVAAVPHAADLNATANLAAANAAELNAAGLTAAAVPCPRPKVAPPPNRPPRPVPPKSDPVLRAVGGEALATDGLVVPAGAPKPPAVSATSWLVADLDSGEVLGGCGPHVYGTPASVQKLLLVATVMRKLDANRVARITDADLAIEPGSSAVGLLPGGRYSVRTLWLGLLLNSGNDAANALARLGGGAKGLPGTVAAMNAEAKRLGAFQTRAVTPSGLDGPGQFTSAYDLALIARECFDIPAFRRYALTERTRIPAQPAKKAAGFEIQNENKLIYNYPGALGGKTGFTTLARHSYVGAAERGGRRLVVTLLGAEANPQRGWQQGASLLDWGFALRRGASVGELVSPDGAAAAGPSDGASTAATAPRPRPVPAAARNTPERAMPVPVAAVVAILVAAAPVLLVTSMRRRRMRRRVRRWQG